ncbi:hypothetical protein JCM17960_14290 [Magnetospira thiophila]
MASIPANNNPPLRLGLIGAGRWGRVFIRTLARLAGLTLTRLASGNPESRTLVPETCQISDNWHEVARATDLDGLIIATPPDLHAPMARAALAVGTPVLIEKPLTLNVAEALSLLQYAQQQPHAIVQVDHIHLAHPAYRRLKQRCESGGAIRAIHGQAGAWGPFRPDTSVLWDWGPHDVALCLDLLGQKPTSVRARIVETRDTEAGPGQSVRLDLTFPGGVTAHLELSNLRPEKRRSLTVERDEDTLIYDAVGPRPLVSRTPTGAFPEPDLPEILPLDQVVLDFAAAIRKGGTDLASLKLAVDVVKVLGDGERDLNSN